MNKKNEELKGLGLDTNAIKKIQNKVSEELPIIPDSSQETTVSQSDKTSDLVIRINCLLKNIGVPFHIKGKRYIEMAIHYCIENNKDVADISVTRELYPMMAKQYKTTSSSVERAIRHACELTVERGNPTIMYSIFGYTVSCNKRRPTNSELIAMLVNYINLGEDLK